MHKLPLNVLTCAALLVSLAAPAGAQLPDTVRPGVRVRMTMPDTVRQEPLTPSRQWLRGTVERVAADTLYLSVANAGGVLAIPRTSPRRLDVSRGVPSRPTSALRQGLSLALAGTLVATITEHGGDPQRWSGDAALAGAGVGFGVGLVLGAAWPSERWRRVPLR